MGEFVEGDDRTGCNFLDIFFIPAKVAASKNLIPCPFTWTSVSHFLFGCAFKHQIPTSSGFSHCSLVLWGGSDSLLLDKVEDVFNICCPFLLL